MTDGLTRRELLRQGAAGAGAARPGSSAAKPLEQVRLGLIGAGNRGLSHLGNFLRLEKVLIRAVCDLAPEKVERAQALVAAAGQERPEGYARGPTDYRRLCAREDFDLVFIATPWEWHTPMCVEAMRNGKHAAVEVPAATTLEECWQLVETAEQTRRQCVQMENCNYDRVELMTLHMVRKGLLGELVHAECGYLHDLRESKLRLREGRRGWRVEHSLRHHRGLSSGGASVEQRPPKLSRGGSGGRRRPARCSPSPPGGAGRARAPRRSLRPPPGLSSSPLRPE